GPLLARLYMRLVRRLSDDAPSQIILQFVGTFGVWMLAERIGLSGVLTIVCYAIAIAQEAPDRTPARLRVPSYAVWETAVFVLNVLAFFLIGLQIRPIMEALDPAQQARYLVVAGAVLATVIAVRIAWVMAHNTVARLKIRLYGFHPPRPMSPPTLGGAGAAGFPFRDLIVLTAFIVVLGTLVIQGLTLRPVLGWLDLRDDDPVGREVARARDAAFRAALEALDGDTSTEAKWLRKEYTAMLRQAGDAADPRAPIALPADDLRRRAIAAARAAVSDLR